MAYKFVNCTYTAFSHNFSEFLCYEHHKVYYIFRFSSESLSEFRVLCFDTNGAGIKVADSHHNASQCNRKRLQTFPNSLIYIMLKLFAKYTSIGVINTLIHWVVFAVCIYAFHTGQALGNFAGFVVAVSFSFFANARFTFKSSTTTMRYMRYVGFMGSLSAAVGWAADRSGMAPIVTLILFSAISLVCGFIYSKFIVFRDAK